MGIMVYSLLWIMQDFVHQPYHYLTIQAAIFLGALQDYEDLIRPI